MQSWPPTPTPQPPGQPYFPMPDNIGLWGHTDTMFQVWFWLGVAGQVLQLIIGIFIIVHFVGKFTRRDAEN